MTNRQARRDQARAARTQRSRTPSQRPQPNRPSSGGGGGSGLLSAPYLIAVAALVVVLGVFDLWGDFRNLSARPADATAGRDTDG